MMSCQSIAARAFPDTADASHSHFHRSVRFSSECRSSTRDKDVDSKKESTGSMSLTPLSQGSAMSQSAPACSFTFDLQESPAPPAASCRFPKLEDCAHFHYERVSLGGLSIETVPMPSEEMATDWSPSEGWICLKVRSHVNSSCDDTASSRALTSSWTEASDVREWTLTRNRDHLLQLDDMLHRCIYDRKVSGLPNLAQELSRTSWGDAYARLIGDYVHHLAIIADDSINCGPVLNWLQMDNKGHKLLVANEDSSSINTPAVAAAYSVRKYVSQARDEISFDVGDMISVIDMPGPNESLWWRGKRGFRVGFFPHHCVAVIGDKVPRHMTQPPPIVGSVAMAPIKPVLRKHGKLISLFRSFILSRPSRRSLKQQGILRERVFGCDLGEHLLNCGHEVPLVLVECARAIEARGAVDGIYRLSGGAGLTQRLRSAFDAGGAPDLSAPAVLSDPHAVASLLKMYFRELPNPLCTYQLYESFVSAVGAPDEAARLKAVRDTVTKLPPPHYRTLAYLMRHLRHVSLLGQSTGMTARNMAIVWAPNLLRAVRPHHALQGVAVQAVVTEFLICYAEELFAEQQPSSPSASGPSSPESSPRLRRHQEDGEGSFPREDSCRRPKSLPLHPPTKLLSLEEARRRGGVASSGADSRATSALPVSGAIAAAARDVTLRPQPDHKPKYIEVGSGPNNLPQYHTVLDLPVPGRAAGRAGGPRWRGLFSRKQPRAPPRPAPPAPRPVPPPPPALQEVLPVVLREVRSCESLASDSDTLAPLAATPATNKQHTRSSSCDSYFEPWQTELSEMRLRLAPQERQGHMFSDEERQEGSACSTPEELCSCEPSPRRMDSRPERERCGLEEQIASISYIDGESPRAGKRAPPRPHTPPTRDVAKRLCKDRESPMSSVAEFQTQHGSVKMRERNSPRKGKGTRYTGMPANLSNEDLTLSRLSWHGDGHSTLIKIDWPADNSSTNLTASTANTPLTPVTPNYETLESDSEISDKNHTNTIKISHCGNCREEKCLKCELKATDYENVKFKEYSPNISYQNLNRLSAVSSSTDSDRKKDENMKVMTSSHESSSSYSNASPKLSDDYESYNFRPNYINLHSSSTSKSSPGSPLKSPLKSTISITFRSPTKMKKIDADETPTNDRDSIYEDVVLDKNLSIVEEATIPHTDASLPTPACQPSYNQDLLILESQTDEGQNDENVDVYSQVKFFKKSIEEVNAMMFESPEKERHYENVPFGKDYENISVDTLKICEKNLAVDNGEKHQENGNIVQVKNLNVKQLAIRFESPTEQKGPFIFEKFKAEIKYPSLERADEKRESKKEQKPPKSPKSSKLSKSSLNARSLDENAFVKEFGDKSDRRKSLEVRESRSKKYLPDLNLNMAEEREREYLESVTPTTENKISLIQRFDVKPDIKNLIGNETEKLSRERIEKYKEERRNFLREKYSSQSFRSNPDTLTRVKIKKGQEVKDSNERLKESPKFERRNTVDLGQRMRFSLTKSANNIDSVSLSSPKEECKEEERRTDSVRMDTKEKLSPSYNIRDMTAMFEQKSQQGSTG